MIVYIPYIERRCNVNRASRRLPLPVHDMSITVDVGLLSGRTASVQADLDEEVAWRSSGWLLGLSLFWVSIRTFIRRLKV